MVDSCGGGCVSIESIIENISKEIDFPGLEWLVPENFELIKYKKHQMYGGEIISFRFIAINPEEVLKNLEFRIPEGCTDVNIQDHHINAIKSLSISFMYQKKHFFFHYMVEVHPLFPPTSSPANLKTYAKT